MFGATADVAAPWLLLGTKADNARRSCFLHTMPLPMDKDFVDARIGRIVTIATSLLLTSHLVADWSDIDGSCKLKVRG